MAIDLTYIPLDPSEFPIEITYEFSGVNYNIEFRINDVNDFITMDIRDEDDESLYTARIKYLAPVKHVVVDGLPFTEILLAFSVTDIASDLTEYIFVTPETLGDTVLLYALPQV